MCCPTAHWDGTCRRHVFLPAPCLGPGRRCTMRPVLYSCMPVQLAWKMEYEIRAASWHCNDRRRGFTRAQQEHIIYDIPECQIRQVRIALYFEYICCLTNKKRRRRRKQRWSYLLLVPPKSNPISILGLELTPLLRGLSSLGRAMLPSPRARKKSRLQAAQSI